MREKPRPSTALLSTQIQLAEQIAWHLQSTSKDSLNRQWAWVCHQQKIYWTADEPQAHRPSSAIVKLIQFLFEKHIDHSFFILRNRLFTTAKITDMDTGMVKLAAKRISGEIKAKDQDLSLSHYEWIQVGPTDDWYLQSQHAEPLKAMDSSRIQNEKQAQEILAQLEKQVPRGEVLHDYNRPIAVLITDATGEVLASSVNANFKNKTLHAEVRAAQEYFHKTEKPLPVGAKIYVSLKPCQMCAAMLAEISEDPRSLQVYFCQDDPGIRAQNTAFDKLGCQKKLGN